MNKFGFKTEQEEFWAGEFGTNYIWRNKNHETIAANVSFLSRALRIAGPIRSCIEFGANIGLNIAALRTLYPEQLQYAVEINKKAVEELLLHLSEDCVFEMSILEFDPHVAISNVKLDLVLTKGLLIHINPEMLQTVYEKLYACTSKYLLIAEYYNPPPISVNYRGHENRLLKRDFAGEKMDKFPNLILRDYGFLYHRDPTFPQDDITWFLLEKTKHEHNHSS